MEDDLLTELNTLVSNMLVHLKPHYVPMSQSAQRQLMILAAATALLLMFISLIINIVRHSKRKKKDKERLEQFELTVGTVEMALDIDSSGNYPGNKPTSSLVRQCATLGEEIDWHTNRPHNSKFVALLSYQIALSTKMSTAQAAMCFCCALVADAGMLDLPRQLFFREILSSKERKLLRTQCNGLASHLEFVPSCYFQHFLLSGFCRRENYDGSGYPEGLAGSSIPVLARIIRVAEDFTGMTGRRAQRYLLPLSSMAAVRELRRSAGLYDQRIVNIVEKIVMQS